MTFVLDHHVDRHLEDLVLNRLTEEPVIALQGMRSVGKSTILKKIALASDREVIDLDDPENRDDLIAEPRLFVGRPSPVLIDEFQHVPVVLDAIKAELNRDLRPGRFVLTGSTSYESLPRFTQSLAGRIHIMSIWPLSQGELSGVRETFVETLLDDPRKLVTMSRSKTTRADYIERIVGGGMPVPLARASADARSRWFDDYIDRVAQRDVVDIARIRQRERMPALFARLAGQGAQVLNISRAARDTGLEVPTAESYIRLLEAVFLVYRLPAWGTTLRARATARPKIHVTDSGLAAHALRLTEESLARATPTALSEFGHLMESFVVAEIQKQIANAGLPVHTGHWRTHDGGEVDLVLERRDGTIVGVEIKSTPRIRSQDGVGLRKLRAALGDTFLGGVILHTGEHSYTIEDRLYALPLDRLWTA